MNTNNLIALPSGTLLHNKYLIDGVLGSGGFGITYLVRHIRDNSVYAVKEYVPVHFISYRSSDNNIIPLNNCVHLYEKGKARFIDEAQTLYKLKGNSCVVNIIDYFEMNNTAYFTMEYLNGRNLKQLMNEVEKKQINEIANKMLIAVIKAMIPVHDAGILHRDISPANIIVTAENEIKLIDFGAAKHYVAGGTIESRSVILKHGYAPPEQYMSRGNQGPWTDVYALAATYYHMVTGTTLPDSISRYDDDIICDLYKTNSGIPKEISDAIKKALMIDIRDRIKNMREFYDLIHEKTSIPNKQQYIVLLSGSVKGHKWIIEKDTDIKIGRSKERANVIINDEKISRIHCTISYDSANEVFLLTDHSINGTYLYNGTRLIKGKPYTLKSNDIIYLQSNKYLLQVISI